MIPTRKEFLVAASSAKPGEIYQIKIAQHWEYGVGFGGFYWVDGIFVAVQGSEAIFQNKLDPSRKIYVEYRDIKLGRTMVVWDRQQVFSASSPSDVQKNNVVSMWEPGRWKHY